MDSCGTHEVTYYEVGRPVELWRDLRPFRARDLLQQAPVTRLIPDQVVLVILCKNSHTSADLYLRGGKLPPLHNP